MKRGEEEKDCSVPCLWPPAHFGYIKKDLRSAGNLDAGNAILEAVRPQAGDVLVTHLHLTALEVWAFKQANLVVLRVLDD